MPNPRRCTKSKAPRQSRGTNLRRTRDDSPDGAPGAPASPHRPIHGEIVAAARRPALYQPLLAAPDTFDGRFEMVTLHAGLVMRRLMKIRRPGRSWRRISSTASFVHFDVALRETGAWRCRRRQAPEDDGGSLLRPEQSLWRGWLDGPRQDRLTEALARNVYAACADVGARARGAAPGRLSCAPSDAVLAATPLEDIRRRSFDFPAPTRIAHREPEPWLRTTPSAASGGSIPSPGDGLERRHRGQSRPSGRAGERSTGLPAIGRLDRQFTLRRSGAAWFRSG